ncbi:SufS family cysteine desulfurase [Zooshikella harenae]|uniref:cysteine desulfurase n=1 Tax=Zooshikella harenae TaxID=2827238 RepID=A0ABS5ZIK4_9GAMM|nr:SufS family cysteine desulfurase [Zooshikella harenae]MBU2712842.1 SufS family cysteine desulfurase [Zooshikella harenae]
MSLFNVNAVRQDFPGLLHSVHGHPLVYFDNAATTHKPTSVIQAEVDVYQQSNANVHRASHYLSSVATQRFENARKKVQRFVNATRPEEIIWTKGATESLNLIAQSYGLSTLQKDDEILISPLEHHANIVPWQIVAQQTGAKLKILPLSHTLHIDPHTLPQHFSEKTRLLILTHVSNALGVVNDIAALCKLAKQHKVTTVVDGAQAVGHFPIDVQQLGCDFYVFSGHKMYGPTGIGVLYGCYNLLEAMPPWQTGGEMIQQVSFEKTTYNQLPFKFEPGTPNIAGAIGLGAAIDYLEKLDRRQLITYEHQLMNYLQETLNTIPGINIITPTISTDQSKNIPIVALTFSHEHIQDIGMLLDQKGIAVRVGHHCTMPLMAYLGIAGTLRISLSFYNTRQEIDWLVESLNSILKHSEEKHSETAYPSSKDLQPLSLDSQQIASKLLAQKNWENRYRLIMQNSKLLPPLPTEYKIEDNRVSGCESEVWLVSDFNVQNKTLQFWADSNARILRGLLTLVISHVNNKTPEDILASDFQQLFSTLDLAHHLSPSRSNGLNSIVNVIQQIAQDYLTINH